jgi:hypothetical protein
MAPLGETVSALKNVDKTGENQFCCFTNATTVSYQQSTISRIEVDEGKPGYHPVHVEKIRVGGWCELTPHSPAATEQGSPPANSILEPFLCVVAFADDMMAVAMIMMAS